MNPLALLPSLHQHPDARYPVLLHSGDPDHPLSRQHYLACNPSRVVRGYRHVIEVEDASGRVEEGPARAGVLEDLWDRFLAQTDGAGIAVGYFGYEFGTWLEQVPRAKKDVLGLPDFWFGFYPAHGRIVCGNSGDVVISGTVGGIADLEVVLKETCSDTGNGQGAPSFESGALEAAWSRERYGRSFRRVMDYIHAGDIYQANLAQRFRIPFNGNAAGLFQSLALRNPVPYGAFLDCGDHQVLSQSPECFLRVDGDRIETMPIKGTRPRGVTEEEDAALREELRASDKDAAEHVMIVDLERNDLGRLCEIGSVHVPDLLRLESYSRVHHLVSTIRGRLRPRAGLLDILRGTFPGGSITGAPKIRAMEIIAELEGEARGVYTGAIGMLSGARDLNLSIAIRTAVLKDGALHYHAGGGLVADSVEESEYEETFHKMAAFQDGLKQSEDRPDDAGGS